MQDAHRTKILFLDIETAPNVAYVWGLFDQNIAHNQVETSSYILCWSAQWHGQPMIMFDSVQKHGRIRMLKRIHGLLHEADIVVHYNGSKFDIPTLNKEFVKHHFRPPSPYKQIDMLSVCRRMFRFESNKLASVVKSLDLSRKIEDHGFKLWVDCMKGKRGAWRDMEHYNRNDVKILAQVYHRLLPWITKHPFLTAAQQLGLNCPKCGSAHLQSRGSFFTRTAQHAQYQCRDCGGWFRSNKVIKKFRHEFGVNI